MTSVTPFPQFSFLLPTRGNPAGVQRFFQSIVDTTSRLEDLEIILAVDDDDFESQTITHDLLTLKKIVLPRGATMGNLNRACFELAGGRYIMLVNDDILLRTKDWDRVILRVVADYPDDIVLIHVNDLLFREKLCTFPMLSRRACLEIGACPAGYRRYRIDDHIYDTYSLLASLGHPRIVYLPEVIFEHQNHSAQPEAEGGHLFKSVDNKVYSPNQAIIELDARQFGETLAERKQAALQLASLIDEYHCQSQQTRQRAALTQLEPGEKAKAYQFLLAGIQDSYSYRRSEFVREYSSTAPAARTTIAVVTSDLRKEHAAHCIALIKEHTHNYDLVILDNSHRPGFRHTHEMNKVLRMVETDTLVLMDDDVFVGPGWLEGLLRCLDDQTALVAPLHRDRFGKLSFSGVYFAGDGQGTHAHLLDRPERPRATQTVCSALILVDLRKCAGIFMDEVYAKYFLDLDYSLRVWEAGYQVIVTPEVTVTHLGGATMVWGSAQAEAVQKHDRQWFIERWLKTGRLAQLEQGRWQNYSELRPLLEIPSRINQFFDHLPAADWHTQLPELIREIQGQTLFEFLLRSRLEAQLSLWEASGDAQSLERGRAILHPLYKRNALLDQRSRWEVYQTYLGLFFSIARQDPKLAIRKAIKKLLGIRFASRPVLVESNYLRFNVVHYQNWHYGLATALGEITLESLSDSLLREHQRQGLIVVGYTAWEVKGRILWNHISQDRTRAWPDLAATIRKGIGKLREPGAAHPPKLMAGNYLGYNLVHYQREYFGLSVGLGPLELETLSDQTLKECQLSGAIILGQSAREVKLKIIQIYLGKMFALLRADRRLVLRKVFRKLIRPKDPGPAKLAAEKTDSHYE